MRNKSKFGCKVPLICICNFFDLSPLVSSDTLIRHVFVQIYFATILDNFYRNVVTELRTVRTEKYLNDENEPKFKENDAQRHRT